MPICKSHDWIAELENSGKLNELIEKIKQQIRSSFRIEPVSPCVAQPVILGQRTFSVEMGPIVLSRAELAANRKSLGVGTEKLPILRGLFNYLYGRLFLVKDNYCIETVIHETLHGFSFYGRFVLVSPPHDTVKDGMLEGLTEALTGKLMLDMFPQDFWSCYCSIRNYCSYTYGLHTKIFGTLLQSVGLEPFVKFYFWNPSDLGWCITNYLLNSI